MCATCGCAGGGAVVHMHDHSGRGTHEHEHIGGDSRTVLLRQKVLAKNDGIAAANRDWLAARGVFMLNLMSSPGAGKTTLLEHTTAGISGRLAFAVIEGDLQTALDADRITRPAARSSRSTPGAAPASR